MPIYHTIFTLIFITYHYDMALEEPVQLDERRLHVWIDGWAAFALAG